MPTGPGARRATGATATRRIRTSRTGAPCCAGGGAHGFSPGGASRKRGSRNAGPPRRGRNGAATRPGNGATTHESCARQWLEAGCARRAPPPAAVAEGRRAPRALLLAVRAVVAPCAHLPALRPPMRRVIGIDPGALGGLAVLDLDDFDDRVRHVELHRTPRVEVLRNRKRRLDYDPAAMRALLARVIVGRVTGLPSIELALEAQGARPGQ